MASLRVMICDDEPLALDRLTALLARCADVAVVGAAISGQALMDALATTKADAVLLDIEMPLMDGFDVVEAMSRMEWDERNPPPLVIFATARTEFAIEAFDSGALDFISKPVRLGRLEQALDRARRSVTQIEALSRLQELTRQLETLKDAHAGRTGDHIWVRKGAETIRLDVQDIDWASAEGEYVRFYVGEDSYLERGSLQNAAVALEPFGFSRVHRSAIVNMQTIGAVEKGRWGGLTLKLVSGKTIRVGKKYRDAVQSLLRNGPKTAG